MKSGSLVKPILLSSIFFLLMLSLLISSVAAIGVYPLCLTKGQVLRFSLCNPTIADRVCTKALCQYCISESSPGIYCPASLNACNTGSQDCVYLSTPTPTQVLINITLTEPINNYNITVTSTNSISFKFKVTNSSLLSSCNLFINDTNLASNQTKLSSSINTIQVNVNPSSPGNYNWYIRCTNKSGSSFYSENRNLIISPNSNNNNSTNSTNSTSPVFYNVNALTPQNQSQFSEGIISFSYNLSNLSSTTLKTCNLLINGNIVNSTNSTSTPGISNKENIISQNLSAGSYYWNINCISKVSNPSKNYSSEKRLITITSSTPTNPTNPTDGGSSGGGSSGGGGGGGGSSSSSSQPICLSSVWNCTKWTACKNSSQTRVCTLTRTDCKAQTKPEESVKCIQVNPNNNQDNNNSNNANTPSNSGSEASENNPSRISGITGAFIGSLSNQKVWLPIAIIIAVVILLIIIQLIRKNLIKK